MKDGKERIVRLFLLGEIRIFFFNLIFFLGQYPDFLPQTNPDIDGYDYHGSNPTWGARSIYANGIFFFFFLF